jgi:tRNA (guanine-N7-)-methyltransferase
MRLKNIPAAKPAIEKSDLCIKTTKDIKGTWKKSISGGKPIYLEIGMGKGQFIIKNALLNKDINYIGIEKEKSIVYKALNKVLDTNDKGIDNLVILNFDAANILDIFEDNEVDKIYLNFSDPWPKKRHAKKRLTSDIFLEKYKNVFKKDNNIIMKTDNMNLFEYSLESLSRNGYALEKVSLDLHNSEIENNAETEYEKRFVAKGNKIYYVSAKKLV